MKVNEIFLKACKDRTVSSLCIFDRLDNNGERRQNLQLSIPIKPKYNNNFGCDSEYICTDTVIRYEDYSGNSTINKALQNNCLVLSTLVYNRPHLFTFLRSIKKDSEVSFKVIAFNGNDNYKNVNFVSHQIYGIIDEKYYFLENYTGPDNTASPIRY